MRDIINKYIEKYGKEVEIDSVSNIVYKLLEYITDKDIDILKLGAYIPNEKELELLDDYMGDVVEKNIPIQYITGRTYLYNEEYIVNENVLIPRQDTETLIEQAIKCITDRKLENMLDLCTGSGAVGISISKNSDIKKCILMDISKDAINITNKNIILNNVKDKCDVMISNMFENLGTKKFDIIVSNPPYIERKSLEKLSNFVKKEPMLALDGGKTGLDFYNIIYEEGKKYLNNNGYILVEIGYNQKETVQKIINKYTEYTDIEVIKDINGKNRVIKCRFLKK